MATAAQEEFRALTAGNSRRLASHPEDARTSTDSSLPGTASSRASSPSSSAISPTMPDVVYQIPSTQFEANTGPKGVIADAQSYERARKRTFRQTIYGMTSALGNNMIGVSEKLTASVRTSSKRRPSERSSSDGSSEDEDEFMRSWREKRMAELKKSPEVRTRRVSPSKRRWGRLVTVDAIGYLDAIEKVASDTVVVVMIANDESATSGAVENALQNLARKHDVTRFVKLSYEEAEMDIVCTPAILAYRNGDLFANMVSVVEEIPADRGLSASSLEDLLRHHRVLP